MLLAAAALCAKKPSVIFHAAMRFVDMNAASAPFVGLIPDASSNPTLNPFAPNSPAESTTFVPPNQ